MIIVHTNNITKDEEMNCFVDQNKRISPCKEKFLITDCSLNDDCKSCQSVSESSDRIFMEKCKIFPP